MLRQTDLHYTGNEAGKGNHRHRGSRETAYRFSTPERLVADFQRGKSLRVMVVPDPWSRRIVRLAAGARRTLAARRLGPSGLQLTVN